jgi:hypothetical protein
MPIQALFWPILLGAIVMGKKLDRVYHALVDGASEGLTDGDLYKYVLDQCPKTSSKRIVKASLLALSDPHLKDRNVLSTIYALAIKYRLVSLGVEDDLDDEDEDRPAAPSLVEKTKKRLEETTADIGGAALQ